MPTAGCCPEPVNGHATLTSHVTYSLAYREIQVTFKLVQSRTSPAERIDNFARILNPTFTTQGESPWATGVAPLEWVILKLDFGSLLPALEHGTHNPVLNCILTNFYYGISSTACGVPFVSAVFRRASVTQPAGAMRSCAPCGPTCRSSTIRAAWRLGSKTVVPPHILSLAPTLLLPQFRHHFATEKPALVAASAAEPAASTESNLGDVGEPRGPRGARGRRPVNTIGTSSASVAPPSAADLAAANLLSDEALRAMGIKLPSHCCGCGMKLQRQDERAPGFFTIPARLLEPPRGAAGPAAAGEDAGEVPVVRRELGNWGGGEDRHDEVEFDDVGALGADEPDVLCQRCYWLTHAGKLKSYEGEAALPTFDLSKKVGRKIHLQKDRKAVVLCVVDLWDFDGSLPRQAISALLPPGSGDEAPQELKFKLMVAANKFDLLPSVATVPRVQQWVRTRLKQAGLPHADKVFMVSAAKGLGVKDMDIRQALGFRGDLWVVGAQNAGKSSLIRAMKRLAGTDGKGDPTVAPVPGTTLGLLQVPGIPLGPKHRTFDTPGVPHTHQLTSHLNPEVVKKPGHSVLLGAGLARVDVVSAPGQTLYLTVFVSAHVNLHMGKTEGADDKVKSLTQNGLLSPPESPEEVAALPKWQPVEVEVEGTDWSRSTVDVAVAGLGWVGVGCRGKAHLRFWTLPGVAVTTHAALIPDYAKEFEKKGVSTLLPRTPKKQQARKV
ncbi:hypothetical protein VOLCADRAFT_118673 [Volvox carteri f. nagariensis]|uniref:Uncharacterized protein n=1 Tax=Volvox carteri f. nagariensis TaxID=3068 RepID=D8U6J8_VOLCA|nr:uncharacterized protein VOLCADRAFT_118673 [Volvox carteri f. nagariensis]EFJ44727.1 hypothetical protein VOLCADRAFT_118673 [Volvox carteri f. nagariensis]|eukprot:XP_002954303.1 hypothetical protein VOLCADRAFT_118673 [Volvox carteri f. nagariensis]